MKLFFSAQIKKKREKEQRNSPIEEGKQSFSCYICNYTIYECMHCAHKQIARSSFIKHLAKHYIQTTFKCTNCDASFITKRRLENHILQRHPEFAAPVSSKSSKIRECTHCEYKTTFPHCLASHMIKHTGAKLKCTKCEASFTTIRTLDDHILRKHPEFTTSVSSKIHRCTHCEYKTTYKGNLVRHMMKHTGAKLKCTKCDKSFTATLSLDDHILRKHPDVAASVSRKIHKCTHCEYKTTFPHCLASHMMKHTGAKLKCTKCDKSFTIIKSLDHHILRKHPDVAASVSCKIHKCTHCEYKTTFPHFLASHMMKHTGAKLKCTKCDKSFTTTLSLDDHILRKHPDVAASVSRIKERNLAKRYTVGFSPVDAASVVELQASVI
ncbi:unnamed protein product [Acanthoscelides obtectus]|uniref:C2H2-type domain-containing protein n=1 Tax=Acanthoscelides obtectus TaxID=200917 RepID=A0A9P0QBW6_ACAOB|nr:unnamed protein product [Acanthoscelides obtectus]CAK1670559.1 Zinc finger protein 57 [Acanthoscelides obtectus]